MPAKQRYLTSLHKSFSTFLTQNYVYGEIARQAESLYLKLLGWKTDYTRWSVDEVRQFLTETQINTSVLPQVQSLLTQFVKDFPPHQANVFLHEYLLAIKQDGCSSATIRNYRSDIRQFVRFSQTGQLKTLFIKPKLAEFVSYQLEKGLKESSITRKLSSIAQFGWWLQTEGLLTQDLRWIDQASVQSLSGEKVKSVKEKLKNTPIAAQFKPGVRVIKPTLGQNQRFGLKKRLRELTNSVKQVVPTQTRRWLLPYLNLAFIALVFIGLGYFGYRQLFVETADSLAYPSTPTRPNRVLSFQGRLTDTAQNPLTVSTNMRFYLFDAVTSGTQLWDSTTCAVTPDQDGIFTVNLGDDCGSEITEDVFSENANIWLEALVEAETLTPRQPIRTVAYALNAETVQGYPIDSSGSATVNTILTMNDVGDIVLGEVSPKIRAVSGTFTLEGEALTLSTVSGSDGDITFSPDGLGGVISDAYFSAPGATLSATYAGGTALTIKAGPSATANIMEWQDSGGTALGVIDENGNIGIGISNPSQVLDVNGSIQADSFFDSADNNYFLDPAATGDSLTVAGNVGIGITSPLFKLDVAGTASVNSLNINDEFTFPTTDGTTDYILQTDGAGTVSWTDPAGAAASAIYWDTSLGALYPKNSTMDLLIGGQATSSAKFAVLNMDSGTPTASVSAGAAGASYLTADGILQTTANQLLTLGGDTTGDIYLNGNVGISTASPLFDLDVAGTASVNSLNINDEYTFPTTDGSANNVLITDGGGNVTWNTLGAASITDDSLDYAQFQDTMDLDANLILNQGSYTWTQNFTGTTTDGLTYNANSLTSGNAFALSSTSTTLTTGSLLNLDWSPGSSTTATGDLLSVNVGVNGTVGNLLNIMDDDSSVFSVSQTAVTSNLPTSFTSAGDVAIAYDLNFTNPTASYIKSAAPLYLEAGETFGSSDLTLRTYNSGDVVIDASGGVTLAQAQDWDLADSETSALNIESGLLNLDTTNSRVGIGITTPLFTLDVAGTASVNSLNINDEFTFPTTDGTTGYILQTNGGGTVSWADPALAGAGSVHWSASDGAIYPKNSTMDLLIGGQATSSAKFAVLNMDSGTPTASVSAGAAGASYLTADGILQTTANQLLTLGGDTTGDIYLNGNVTSQGNADFAGTLTAGTANAFNVDASGNIDAGTWTADTIGVGYGGTGLSSYAVGDLIYADGASSLAKLADVATGNVLLSGGVGVAPSWGKVTLGTHTTGNYVSSLTGTANQITVSAATGDVTLSLPSDLRAPGTVNAVSGLYTGATAGTQRITAAGNLTNIGTTQLNGETYTWPASQTTDYILQTNGSGDLSWVDAVGATADSIPWIQNDTDGTIYPKNSTTDLLIGGQATSSAKFAVLNMDSGTPTASVSAGVSGTSAYLTADGVLATTNMTPLTIGGSTTGPIQLSPKGTTGLYVDDTGNVGIGNTAPGAYALNVSGNLATTGYSQASGDFTYNSSAGQFSIDSDAFDVTDAGVVSGATGISSSGNIDLDALNAGGLVKAAVTTGRLSIATAGTDYENPLTFSNGLTRTVDAVKLGGALTATTDIPLAGFDMTFSGSGNLGIGVTDPDTKLEVFNAGDQLKLSFDAIDNAVFAVDTNGVLAITPSGASISLVDKNITNVGDIALDSLSSDGSTITVGNGTSNNIVLTDDAAIAISLGSDAGDDFIIDGTTLVVEGDNNRVGIGTATPLFDLDVAGTASVNSLNINDEYTFPTADGTANYVLTTDGVGGVTWSSVGAATIADDSLDFNKFEDTMDLDANLILNQAGYTWTQNFTGTTATGYTYNANSLTSGSGIALASTATGLTGDLQSITLSGSNVANTGSILGIDNTGTLNTNTSLYIKHYATGTNNLAFRVDDVSGDTTPFVIDGSGNVGIGTATPDLKLEVEGASNQGIHVDAGDNAYVAIDRGATNNGATTRFQTAGSDDWFIGSTDSDSMGDGSEFFIGTGVSSSSFWIETTGNVGIGTTSPDAKLESTSTSSEQLRLTYTDGSAYTGFTVSSSGDLSIDATGGDVTLASGDNLNLTASTDLIFGTTSLGESTSAVDSGAYITGTFDEFDYSNETNVQGVLNDLDTTIGGIIAGTSGIWTDAGSYLYPTSAEVLGNATTAGSNKLAGAYLADSAPLTFGTDNDVSYSFSGTTLAIATGTNDINFDSDTLFVDGSANRVGVGTTTPGQELHVFGTDISSRTDAATDGVLRLSRDVADGSWPSTKDTAADFVLSRYENSGSNYPRTQLDFVLTSGQADSSIPSATILSLQSEGNVGIGTTTPLFLLDVAGTASVNSLNINDEYTLPTTDGTTDYVLQTNGSGTVSWATLGAASITDDSLDYAQFQDTMDLDANLILNQAGYTWTQNFTGTTATGYTYNANSLTSGSGIALASTATGLTGDLQSITLSGSNVANTGSILGIDNTGTLNTNTSLYIKHYATGTNNLAFRVDDVSGDTTPFVIDGSGNVGIGTAAPNKQLEISGTTTPGGVMRLDNADTTVLIGESLGEIEFYSNDISTDGVGVGSKIASIAENAGSLYGLAFSTWDASNGLGEALRIDHAGNVGIGDTSPASMLSVGDGDLFQINSSGIIAAIDNVAHIIDDVSGNLTLTSNSGISSIVGDLYVSSGISTFGTAVSDGTIEATQFCTGDGESNCVTDFSTLGGGSWTDAGSYLYPTSAEVLGNSASAGANKIAGIYLADSAPLTFGLDNDINFSFSGTELATSLGSNTWNIASNLLFLDGSSNLIGIGTNNPLATLDIRSTLGTVPTASISGNTSMATLIVDQSGSGDIFAASSSGLTRFVVNGNGNVGIGVQNPSSKLEIGGSTSTISNDSGDITINAASNFISLAGDSLGNLLDLSIAGDASISGAIVFDGVSPSTIDILNDNRLDFQTSPGGDAGLAAVMSILNNGNVGLGTTTPTQVLDVNGSIQADSLFDSADNSYYLDPAATGDSLIVAGNVGIGTTSPTSQLEIFKSGSTLQGGPAIRLIRDYTSSDYGAAIYNGWDATVGDALIFGVGANADPSGAGQERMIITQAGNVGINTTAPNRKLEILDGSNPQLRISNTATDYIDFNSQGSGRLGISTYDGTNTGTFVFDGESWGDYVAFGSGDTKRALLQLNGGTTGETSGGILRLQTSADHDTTIDYFGVQASADDLNIGPDTDLNSLSYLGGTGDWIFTSTTDNVGIGDSTPDAKLQIHETTGLGGTAGNSQILTQTSGISSNVFRHSEWLYRDATGTDWNTSRLHDGISIDVSFVTPGTDTKVWWERDPSNAIQSWGNGASTYMTLNVANVGIGDATPTQLLDVNGNVQAAIYYDKADNSYYLDPAATGTSLATAGDVDIAAGAGKLDVGTIDPPFTINGEKYATYVASMTGVKEETTGLAFTDEYVAGKGYRHNIDFTNQPEGSDLWLFSKVTNLREQMSEVIVLLSPAGNTRAWYTLDTQNHQLSIYSSQPTHISYRLTAPRFDTDSWSNYRDGGSAGFILEDPDAWELNPDGSIFGDLANAISEVFNTIIAQTAQIEKVITPTIELKPDVVDEVTAEIEYATLEITDSNNNTVAEFNSQGDLTLLGELNAATISAETINVASISARSARIDQLEARMVELEHIKAQTAELVDATISGTLYATRIDGLDDQLAETLNESSFLDKLLGKKAEATESASLASLFTIVEDAGYATDSGSLIEPLIYTGPSSDVSLVASSAFINDYFSVNGSGYVAQQLGVGEQLLVGNSLAIGDNYIEYQPINVEDPRVLHLQPSGQGTLSLMAGLMTLHDNGQILIDGDLAVAGDLEIGGTLLTDLIEPTLFGDSLQIKLATTSGEIAGAATGSANIIESRLEILGISNIPTATISATGRASFDGGLNIGTEDLTPISTMSATITSKQPSGKATIRQNTLGITIKSSLITKDSLIYVSSIGSTGNQILYVKSQTPEDLSTLQQEGGFSVGFDVPISNNATFNWWIVN